MRRPAVLVELLFALVLFSAASAAQNKPQLAHLHHGINISGWFAQATDPKAFTKDYLQSRITKDDIALIKSMGFDHVRLSVDPRPMFNPRAAEQIPSEYLTYLDDAVKMITGNGLAIILDIQPDDGFKAKLADDDFVEQFADFWRALARHYSAYDPGVMFFEILNEPELRDRYRWMGIQAKLAAAIREGAPRQTIIATGAGYSSDDELVFLEPLRDLNVIYSFHFYEPMLFTHQGADWSVYYWHELHGVRYPSDAQSAASAAQQLPDEINRLYVRRYGAEHWDGARIEMEIAEVADWAARKNIPVMCDEFGVFRKYTLPQDRTAWLHDVSSSLARHGISWTLWDYDGSFGIVARSETQKPEKKIPDTSALQAIGLATH